MAKEGWPHARRRRSSTELSGWQIEPSGRVQREAPSGWDSIWQTSIHTKSPCLGPAKTVPHQPIRMERGIPDGGSRGWLMGADEKRVGPGQSEESLSILSFSAFFFFFSFLDFFHPQPSLHLLYRGPCGVECNRLFIGSKMAAQAGPQDASNSQSCEAMRATTPNFYLSTYNLYGRIEIFM